MPITEAELTQAREAWGDALIAISKTYEESGIDAARALANDVLDAAYGYNLARCSSSQHLQAVKKHSVQPKKAL